MLRISYSDNEIEFRGMPRDFGKLALKIRQWLNGPEQIWEWTELEANSTPSPYEMLAQSLIVAKSTGRNNFSSNGKSIHLSGKQDSIKNFIDNFPQVGDPASHLHYDALSLPESVSEISAEVILVWHNEEPHE